MRAGLIERDLHEPNKPRLRARSDKNLIEWPSEQEIHEVSRRLAAISRIGARWETQGEYFNSGDLAYQVREIIRATAELFKKSQRLDR